MSRFSIACLLVVVLLSGSAGGATSYRKPVVLEDGVFPLARSTWYSVINFKDDWHAPRMRRIDGRWRQVGVHEGNDLFAEPGTPVRAVVGGRVEQSGWLFYSGWRIGIRDRSGLYWFYAHLEDAPPLRVGALVAAGDRIGAVGNTGYGDRPGHHDEFPHHLHIGIQSSNGTWLDPYPLMRRLYRATVAADG